MTNSATNVVDFPSEEQAEDDASIGRGTVFYEFKLPLKQYMTATCGIYFPFDGGGGSRDTVENAKEAFFHAKALVIQQLGLEFELEGDVVRAVLEKSFGPTTEVVDATLRVAVATPTTTTPAGLVIEHLWDKQAVPEWLFEAASAAGVTAVKDVRRFLPQNDGNGKANSPWFKAADGTKSEDGRFDLGFWPPRD